MTAWEVKVTGVAEGLVAGRRCVQRLPPPAAATPTDTPAAHLME